jgi:ferredoxin-type protein NapH
MNRQKIRYFILLISLLVFPITIWYFSPYLIIMGATKGIITGSFLVFCMMFLFSIFFGRIFCGYVCPMSGLQECASRINNKAPKQGIRNNIKYMIWVAWIVTIILCFINRTNEVSVDFFYQTDHGISVSNIYAYVIYYGVIFLVLIPAVLFGKRVFCHYFCWMTPFMVIGTKVRNILHLPGLHINTRKDQCISCNKCNQICPMSLRVSEMAKQGKIKSTECIQCGECIDNCPKKVLYYSMK